MSRRAPRALFLGALIILGIATWSGCTRPAAPEPEVKPEPAAPAPPKPPPSIYISSRKLEVSRLFNGLQVRTTLETEPGVSATDERTMPESYALDLQIKIKVPKAHGDLPAITALNDQLATVLRGLPDLVTTAKVSPFFEELYRLKLGRVQRNLARLDLIPSRHNFYDCETVLELEHPKSKRKALLILADMDVDMDGSDSDRVPEIDGSSATFQPMTSYKWPKKGPAPNPFLGGREQKLRQVEKELAVKGLSAERTQQLRNELGAARYEVTALKKYSFLVSKTDPFIALPGSMVAQKNQPYSPRLGDYCAVIHKGTLYPAIFGDVGPTYKMGEASLRLCKELSASSAANNRPVSDLKVTYLVFPGTAESAPDAPDLEKWRTRVAQLVDELGGSGGVIHAWEDLTKPSPPPPPPPPPEVPVPAEQPPTEPAPAPATPGITVEPAAAPAGT